jgi:hypothetical protein
VRAAVFDALCKKVETDPTCANLKTDCEQKLG